MEESTSQSEYAPALRKRLEDDYDRVRDETNQKQERQREFYNRKIHGEPYSVRDLVFLNTPAIPRGQVRKLHRRWTGPFRVVWCFSEATYCIQERQSPRRRLIVHFDRLKPCPPGIRLKDRTTLRPPRVSITPLPRPPPGTNLEVVYSDPLCAPPASRYPSRDRRAPDFTVHAVSVTRIRDGLCQRGEQCNKV